MLPPLFPHSCIYARDMTAAGILGHMVIGLFGFFGSLDMRRSCDEITPISHFYAVLLCSSPSSHSRLSTPQSNQELPARLHHGASQEQE